MRHMVVVVAALGLVSCGQQAAEQPAASAAPRGGGPLAAAETLLDQARVDEALAALEGVPTTAAAVLLQGRIWAKRAELAPPPEPPEEGGPPPEYKLEELNALAFYDTVVQANPDHGEAHLYTARLLAPHARAREAQRRPKPIPEGVRDFGLDAVLREYRLASENIKTSDALKERIAFAIEMKRFDDAEAAYRIWISREDQSAEPLRLLGDLFAEHMDDENSAMDQWKMALVWDEEDGATMDKIATIHLDRGVAQMTAEKWILAEGEFEEAGKYVDPKSVLGRRVSEQEGRLARIRGR